MAEFNLIYKPWIPCLTVEGTMEEYSLQDVLLYPARIREVVDTAPTVTVSLHRLLVAILHRALRGPKDSDEWAEMWEAGEYDTRAVDSYLEAWRERFDLFHPDRPFYQSTNVALRYEQPITKLTHELASPANAASLFDHSLPEFMWFTPAQAARYLVAHQNFAVGGLVSGTGKDKYSTAAPLCKAAICLAKGSNLFQTLMLNLHRYSPEDDIPFPSEKNDLAAWERQNGPEPVERIPTGYVDLLTWQSRRILLIPGDTSGVLQKGKSDDVQLTGVIIMKGYQFPKDLDFAAYETLVPFQRPSPKKPFAPLFLREDRSLWRDSLALLQARRGRIDNNYQAPRLVQWLGDLVADEILSHGKIIPADVYGLTTDRAKVLFWRHERFPLPTSVINDPVRLREVHRCLELAERVSSLLADVLRSVVREALPDGSKEKDVRDVLNSLGPERHYWPALDTPFATLLNDLAHLGNGLPIESAAYQEPMVEIYLTWANVVARVCRRAFEASIASLRDTPRGVRAVALREDRFYGQLRKLTEFPAEERKEVTHG